jgi:hypothetical protein
MREIKVHLTCNEQRMVNICRAGSFARERTPKRRKFIVLKFGDMCNAGALST